MLTKYFLHTAYPGRSAYPGHPGYPAQPERTVCGEVDPGGRYVRTCVDVTRPLPEKGPDGKPLTVTYFVCTSRWVPYPPTGEVACVTYPATPGRDPEPAIEGIPPRVEQDPNLGWNAGANSVATVEGDAVLAFDGIDPVVGLIIGFTTNRGDVGAFDRMSHAFYFYLTNGGPRWAVVEGGRTLTQPAVYSQSDKWRLQRARGAVTYQRNGIDVLRSRAPSAGELSVGCALYSAGDTAP